MVNFKGLDGQDVATTDWRGKPLWVVFFRTDCHYCQLEADNIRKAQGLSTLAVKLISTEPADSVRAFAARYGLDTLAHVQLLTDPHHDSYLTFGATTTSTSFLYDSHGTLIEKFSGVVKVEKVLRLAFGGTK
jgi:peroxiredoxin